MSPDTGIRPGTFVAVVGPSGAGKDTLIDGVRRRFAARHEFMFARRVVTRTADAGAEDHDTLTRAEFDRAQRDGRFAVHWEAHGLSYGIPIEVLEHVERGGTAIANCSRGALQCVLDRFPSVAVINITARPEVLAERLASRGRETRAEIDKRLARSVGSFAGSDRALQIDNSGSLDEAVARFAALLAKLDASVR